MPNGKRHESVLGLVVVAVLASSCSRRPAAVLLYAGDGTSPGDVAAIERLLDGQGLSYALADTRELDDMSDEVLSRHRLLIVPGGNFEVLGRSLAPATSRKVRRVVEHGLSYLGICAGAFFAGASPYNGLDLTSGVRFGFYSAEARGVRRAAVRIETPDGPALEQYWEDGPELSGWGRVIARYPDGTPAAAQGAFGDGAVLLVGVHPEATERWRDGLTFTTAASVDNAWAATLIRAALARQALPHF